MSTAVSHQATEKTTRYSVNKIKKPVLVKSHNVAVLKEKNEASTYSFVGIAG